MASDTKVTWVDELNQKPWLVNKDLLEERKKATFNPISLTNLIDGSKTRTDNRREIELLVYNDDDLKHTDIRYMTRDERYETALKKCILIVNKQRELGLEDEYDKHVYRSKAMGMEQAPFALHHVMFMPALSGQGTPDQQEKWLTLAQNYSLIGTYAQTEIGHGTYLRGLETTATYDVDTDEFVIHSPTLTATKFWPGGLGHTSNHAIVLAQLYTSGQCHGIHPFIVQLRSREDHTPMPGITIGDIGPKNGYESIDNGYLSFNHVRIPRDNMLMRNAEVSRRGTYSSRPSGDRLTLATMMFVRAMIVADMGGHLARAATIAVRYSAVRRQGYLHQPPPPANSERRGEEEKLLNYRSQQHKLFPQLVRAYVYIFLGNRMRYIYFSSIERILSGEVHLLPELHALSAGLKALTTTDIARGIEACREACGGHGFSQASGFALLYASAAPATTYEGDNLVLLLQTARYLLKCYKSAVSGAASDPPLPPSVSYLSMVIHPSRTGTSSSYTVEELLHAYKFRAYWSIVWACDELTRLTVEEGMDDDTARNHMAVYLINAARAHCQYYALTSFHELTSDPEQPAQSAEVGAVLVLMCRFYALHNMMEYAGEFMAATDAYHAKHGGVRAPAPYSHTAVSLTLASLTAQLRPNVVALCDAFDFHDLALQSVLAPYDGHVYHRLLSWAQQSPMNREPVHAAYGAHLRPFLESQRARSKL